MLINKFICFLALTMLSNLYATSQGKERIFKRFKGEVSLGNARPIGSNFEPGSLIALEPKYAVREQLSVGLRMEALVVDRFIDYGGGIFSHENKMVVSFPATADYYFTNNYHFRPFLGIGAGLYGIGIDGYEFELKFGALARAGAELNHFRLAVEYNLVPASNINTYTFDMMGNQVITIEKLTNNYIGLKLGFCFGGGRL